MLRFAGGGGGGGRGRGGGQANGAARDEFPNHAGPSRSHHLQQCLVLEALLLFQMVVRCALLLPLSPETLTPKP